MLVDQILAGDPDTLEGLGEQQLVAEAVKLAYHLDPASLVNRGAGPSPTAASPGGRRRTP